MTELWYKNAKTCDTSAAVLKSAEKFFFGKDPAEAERLIYCLYEKEPNNSQWASELAQLYRGARCLVYPSLYEGFGIPVAEALACGTPVVTSRDSAMVEVAQGKAVLVDPEDVASIAAGIEQALGRSVGGFLPPTWDDAAAGTVAVYREAAA